MSLSCKFNIRDSRILLIINQPQLSIQQQGSLSKKFFTRQENYGPKYPQKKNFWCLMMKKLFSMRRFMWSFNTLYQVCLPKGTHLKNIVVHIILKDWYKKNRTEAKIAINKYFSFFIRF